jgi:hypothetical protein
MVNCTSCCGSRTGSRRSSSESMSVKMAAFAPMPRASETTAIAAKPGLFRSIRLP